MNMQFYEQVSTTWDMSNQIWKLLLIAFILFLIVLIALYFHQEQKRVAAPQMKVWGEALKRRVCTVNKREKCKLFLIF